MFKFLFFNLNFSLKFLLLQLEFLSKILVFLQLEFLSEVSEEEVRGKESGICCSSRCIDLGLWTKTGGELTRNLKKEGQRKEES